LAASTSEKRKAPFLPPLKPTPFPDKTKQALIIEVIGEPDIGKTHFALTAPKPALADTELKAWVVMPKFDNKNWFPIKRFDDIRRFVMTCVNDPSIQSLIIDSSSDLRELAEDEWSEEHGGKRPVATNPQTGRITTVLYGQVYQKIDELFRLVLEAGKNLILTTRMKPEYVADIATGELVRDGYKKTPSQAMIQLRLRFGIPKGDKVHCPNVRVAEVVKNNFFDRNETKPFVVKPTFEKVLQELTQPWTGTIDDIIKEASESG